MNQLGRLHQIILLNYWIYLDTTTKTVDTYPIKIKNVFNQKENIMSNWKYKINIKQHLTGETTWEALEKAAHGIAKEFRKLPEDLFSFNDLDNIEYLEGVSAEFDPEVYDSPYDLQGEINFRLNSLYDFADYERIWCGL